MPRRNANTLPRTYRPRPTHVIIDVSSGAEVYFGTKSDCTTSAERANADAGRWQYRTHPIHK